MGRGLHGGPTVFGVSPLLQALIVEAARIDGQADADAYGVVEGPAPFEPAPPPPGLDGGHMDGGRMDGATTSANPAISGATPAGATAAGATTPGSPAPGSATPAPPVTRSGGQKPPAGDLDEAWLDRAMRRSTDGVEQRPVRP